LKELFFIIYPFLKIIIALRFYIRFLKNASFLETSINFDILLLKIVESQNFAKLQKKHESPF